MNIQIKNIYNDILELSDLEKQKSYWLGKDPKHISSYVEIMNRLFDDDKFDSFIDSDGVNLGVSPKVIKELDKLRTLLNSYSERNSDVEILNDPKWRSIVNQAKAIIDMWNLS